MISPLKRKLVITPLFDPDTTQSGLIIIPDVAKGRSDQGIIKYIGEGCKENWEVGDYVLFSGYDGTLLNIDGEGLVIILPEYRITAKIPNPDNNVTEISGLYFRGASGEYYQATYEMSMELIRDSLQDTEWYRKMNEHKLKRGWVGEKPKHREYDNDDGAE